MVKEQCLRENQQGEQAENDPRSIGTFSEPSAEIIALQFGSFVILHIL